MVVVDVGGEQGGGGDTNSSLYRFVRYLQFVNFLEP